MTFFSLFILFCSLTSTFGGNKHGNDIAPEKIECEEYDDDKIACESHEFNIKGYGKAKCTYVALRSLSNEDNTSVEHVCLPDHCGLFEHDSQRCKKDKYCVWEDDDITQRSHISRCYPACFNKVDMMFLVDGSSSQISRRDSHGVSDFDKNILAIQQFVKNNIPEYGIKNNMHRVREWFLAFGGKNDKDGYSISESLTFRESQKLSQDEASKKVLNLYAPGGDTNLRRALTESFFKFKLQTRNDYQRILLVFSDGAATQHSYLYYNYRNATLKNSLGLIGCEEKDRCEPHQYFDLGPFFWDHLDVYYIFFQLGEDIYNFGDAGISDGPTFAKQFVADPQKDLIKILNNDYSIFTDGMITSERLLRKLDASICSRRTNNPTGLPTMLPTNSSTNNPTNSKSKVEDDIYDCCKDLRSLTLENNGNYNEKYVISDGFGNELFNGKLQPSESVVLDSSSEETNLGNYIKVVSWRREYIIDITCNPQCMANKYEDNYNSSQWCFPNQERLYVGQEFFSLDLVVTDGTYVDGSSLCNRCEHCRELINKNCDCKDGQFSKVTFLYYGFTQIIIAKNENNIRIFDKIVEFNTQFSIHVRDPSQFIIFSSERGDINTCISSLCNTNDSKNGNQNRNLDFEICDNDLWIGKKLNYDKLILLDVKVDDKSLCHSPVAV